MNYYRMNPLLKRGGGGMTIPEIKVYGSQGNAPYTDLKISNQGFSKLTWTATASNAYIIAQLKDGTNIINLSTNNQPTEYDISGWGQDLYIHFGATSINREGGYVIAKDIVFS